jgi:predicted transcriptional regulator
MTGKGKSQPLRSPQEIEALRQRVVEENLTYQQLADELDLSYQRVSQLLGPDRRPKNWKAALKTQQNLARIKELFDQGLSDEQIAAATRLSVTNVGELRRRAGLPRRDPWTKATVADRLKLWRKLYDYTPAISDWNPAYLKRLGYTERLKRYTEFKAQYRCPSPQTCMRLYGSWSNMISEVGVPPAPRGHYAQKFWEGRS